MAITRQKKEEVLGRIENIIKDASTIVFAQFKGLKVAEQTQMRRGLRASAVEYTVAKKTLIKRALQSGSIAGEMPEIAGEVALAYGKDELAPARELAIFVKKYPEQLAFVGGVFGGRFMNAVEIKEIAAIPELEVLRAQFVQLINSPLQRFAVVLSEKAKKN
jgi:large subunit ribosomal protein L10